MSSIQERRKARYSKKKIVSNDDLYKSNDPSVSIDSVEAPTQEVSVSTSTVKRKRRRKKLTVEEYDYQKMAVEFSKENVNQQLFNYRCAMEYLAHVNLQGSNTDLIVDRFKDVIYNYPNVDISSFANKNQAKLHSWVIQQMQYAYGQK